MAGAHQFTRGADLAKAQMRKWENDERTVLEAMAELGEAGKQDHVELVSGKIPTKALRAMGHPFGRGPKPQKRLFADITSFRLGQRGIRSKGGGRRRLNPLPINEQDGDLKRSLRGPKLNLAGKFIDVWFEPTQSIIVLLRTGTRFMIARGFQKEVDRRHAARTHVFERLVRQGLIRP